MSIDSAVQKAVDEELNTKEWPIYKATDDAGLEAAEYFAFARSVMRRAGLVLMPENTHDVLRRVVESAACKPGWCFRLGGKAPALELQILIECEDNYNPGQPFRICHSHPVPITTYNEATWRRWMFDQCMRSMTHELGESLRWGDERPFEPCHAPGEDPYTLHEFRDPIDARKRQDGSLRPGAVDDGAALAAMLPGAFG